MSKSSVKHKCVIFDEEQFRWYWNLLSWAACFNISDKLFNAMTNKYGDRGSPWRSPRVPLKYPFTDPLYPTVKLVVQMQAQMQAQIQEINIAGRHKPSKQENKKSHDKVSNAFAISTLIVMRLGPPVLW